LASDAAQDLGNKFDSLAPEQRPTAQSADHDEAADLSARLGVGLVRERLLV